MGNHIEAPKRPKKISYSMQNPAPLSEYLILHNYQLRKHITYVNHDTIESNPMLQPYQWVFIAAKTLPNIISTIT